tara:strand:- start:2123 stop:2896 length:774 start_codon:yes stop_codon:yes gene_type:complete
MNEYTLYDGSVKLTMDRNHVYRAAVDGAKKFHVPNVTTILGMKDKTRAMMHWQRTCIREEFEKQFPVGQTFKMDEIQRNRAIDTIASAADNISRQAREIGSLTHDYIELRLAGGDAPLPSHEEARNACTAFNNWLGDHDVQVMFTERMCFSKRHFYCGTTDLVATIDGKLTSLDFKTSKAIYPETFLQVSAYTEALEEELGIEIEQRASLRCDKADASYEYLVFPDEHIRDFETFLSLLRLYHFDKQATKELKELAA